ncbi:acyltransferase ChoActase/COT/CPT [Cladochytrium replicatum]|nr:acyltransferase ChoActase/COT/CPT [Cladochytrium replicatum]
MGSLPTFSQQAKLPRLPIPALQETAATYLKSLIPVLTPSELQATRNAVEEFIRPGGIGESLQARLVEYDRTQPNSWLERWWLSLAYLGWRESVAVNSNWYILLKDLPSTVEPHPLQGFSSAQVTRAAGIITNALAYMELIDRELIPAEATKDGPICMDQYRRVFGITRVPKLPEDVLRGVESSVQHKHITVHVKDQVFALDVYDRSSGVQLTITALEKQLWHIIELAEKSPDQAPIGVFTAEHRDTWAKVYEHMEAALINKASFELIETSLFHIALDDYGVGKGLLTHARNTFHGRGARNRWFDKCLTFIVSNDGRAGLNGEHAPCDALIPAYACDYVGSHEPAQENPNARTPQVLPEPVKLIWKVDAVVDEALKKAFAYVEKLIGDSDMSVVNFAGYGSNFIKSSAKVSPDAYSQMCLQLTYYRLHKSFAPTYETASTRRFLHGRTETCRSLSADSTAFITTFHNANATAIEKHKALQKAAKSHVAYVSMASKGLGCDRHLLGLRLCMKPGEKAKIFEDSAFTRSTTWRLSTSQLFTSKTLEVCGFGAVYPDGFGINYMILPGSIRYGIECKKSNAHSASAESFAAELETVLTILGQVCEEASSSAKL